MTLFTRGLRLLKRPPRAPVVPPVADVVARCPVPVFGLDSEVQGLRFKTFTYAEEEVELLFQRLNAAGFGPGIQIGSRLAEDGDTERFLDLLVRAAAQGAAFAFAPQESMQTRLAGMHDDPANPFVMLDEYPLSGQVAEVTLGDGWTGQATVWQWQMPQPLRALVLRREHPLIIASYDITTDNLVQCLAHVVPVIDRPDLIESYQRAFDDRRHVAIEHNRPAKQ